MIIASAVQFRPRLATCPADIADNRRRCNELVWQAAGLQAEFIVLPELAFTGYSFLSFDQAVAVAEPADGATFRHMSSLAREVQAYLAWGYVEKNSQGQLFNSASLVSPDGDLVASSRKINLWGNDFLWATPGDVQPTIAQTAIGTMTVLICRDLRDKVPELPTELGPRPNSILPKKAQIDIVAGCVNWGKGGFVPGTWMDFVAAHNCSLVAANRWGDEVNDEFVQDFGQGGSAIVRPNWSVCTDGLKFGSNCVVVGTL